MDNADRMAAGLAVKKGWLGFTPQLDSSLTEGLKRPLHMTYIQDDLAEKTFLEHKIYEVFVNWVQHNAFSWDWPLLYVLHDISYIDGLWYVSYLLATIYADGPRLTPGMYYCHNCGITIAANDHTRIRAIVPAVRATRYERR